MDCIPMRNQSFEEFAVSWIYLLSATDNTLALVPLGSDFAYEFKWEPMGDAHADRFASGGRPASEKR